MNELYEIKNLDCSYDKHFVPGKSRIVLHIDNLSLPRGKKIFIVGESGIGKSTVLEVLGMMNNTIIPRSDTEFLFFDKEGKQYNLLDLWKRNNDDELSDFRLVHFNFIFQSTNLMRNFTAFENIAITRLLQGHSIKESFDRADKVLADLGMPNLNRERSAMELSGGQQQRLAFARAIVPDFTVLFGDEPTGNLDGENAMKAMEILTSKLNELSGSSAIIVSHDMHLAVSFADVIIKVRKQIIDAKDSSEGSMHVGIIDSCSVFYPDEQRNAWTNGTDTYNSEELENMLRKKI